MYVVHVGRVPGIYLTWEDYYAQVNHYPGNLYKKYNIEDEALRAYYGARSADYGHQPALEIEEKPPAGDMKIRRIAPWSWKDVMLFIYGYGHRFSYLKVDVGLVS